MLKTPAFISAAALCVIAIVGLTRVYDTAPPQALGLTIVVGILIILTLAKFNVAFVEYFESISFERLICWHAIRAPIGAAFLVMSSEGLLPDLFAKRAGYGDILTAFAGLLVVILCASLVKQQSKKLLFVVWNFIGLADLLLAVGTGIYLAVQMPDSMIWIARLPMLLVPTIILPVLFATHFIMLYRLLRIR